MVCNEVSDDVVIISIDFCVYLLICMFVASYAVCDHTLCTFSMCADSEPNPFQSTMECGKVVFNAILILRCSRTSKERRPESCVVMSVMDMVVSVSVPYNLPANGVHRV